MKSDKEIFVRCMKRPFTESYTESGKISARAQASRQREMSRETVLKRVRPQVKEMKEKGLPFSTPEEWDNSFRELGGGQTRRKSRTILSRISWEEFLKIVEEDKD